MHDDPSLAFSFGHRLGASEPIDFHQEGPKVWLGLQATGHVIEVQYKVK